MTARDRPRLHLTADHGWLNDPYGVVHDGERYHVFVQALPDSLSWGPGCTWAHATSPDLVDWQWQQPALAPEDGETGCWSGTVVPTAAGLELLYTSVGEPDLDLGQVVRCVPGGSGWRRAGVVAEPPEGYEVFRDPFVVRRDGGWLMVVGGARDGHGAVASFTSGDLHTWTPAGVLVESDGDDGTGPVWECPQLLAVGDDWVLVVSTWVGADQHLAAAVGSLVGTTFVPRRWQRLGHGVPYAASAFTDRDGLRCLVSWLREEPTDAVVEDFSGAISVVSVISVVDDLVVLTPHPAVADACMSMSLAVGDSASWPGLMLTRSPESLLLSRPARHDVVLPAAGPATDLDLLLDADLAELWVAGGQPSYSAWRL